jgi:nitroimidazol reductase NimA-like FMN-containing flavoprotein (pyridoxamine 5'-phosphate oxidase superfamily)
MSTQPQTNSARATERALLEVSREDCYRLLKANSFGRLAVAGSGDVPLIRPVNYVFDEPSQSIAFRTAAGSKFHSLVRATRAAFETDCVDAATRTGWSVVIVGVTEEVTRPLEVQRLEALDLDTWPPVETSHWIRIRAWTVTGRRVSAPESR